MLLLENDRQLQIKYLHNYFTNKRHMFQILSIINYFMPINHSQKSNTFKIRLYFCVN